MRFAWLRSEDGSDQHGADEDGDADESSSDRLVFIAYNVVWWIPVGLVVVGMLTYQAGSVAFLAVTIVRAVVNVYRMNVVPVEDARRFPLRSP